MSILTIIPTSDNLMSVYTLCALAIIISCGAIAFTLFFRWTSNELLNVSKSFEIVEKCIARHDSYIDTTNEVINRIHIDLAVQESSNKSIKNDLIEIKLLITSINKTLLDKFTGR